MSRPYHSDNLLSSISRNPNRIPNAIPGVTRLSVPAGDINSGGSFSSAMSPAQYITRLTDFSQMDVQCALDQMKSLISFSPLQTQKVYKMAYYRKQTKNHWARDDPAFVSLQIIFLALSSISYTIAFRTEDMISQMIHFSFQSIIVNFILSGLFFATVGRVIANTHLTVQNSPSHVRQGVEWLYAFDIHCNAFFPFFICLYLVQFFLLPIVLGKSLLALVVSNTLYAIAFSWYFYVTHLGYRALPFLSNTEVFLFPIAVVIILYVLNLVAYPFGFGWNASRIAAYLYFEP